MAGNVTLPHADASLPLNMNEHSAFEKTKVAMEMLEEILFIASTTRVPFLQEEEKLKLATLLDQYQGFVGTDRNFTEPMDEKRYMEFIDALVEISIGLTSPEFLSEERAMKEFSANLSRARRSFRSLIRVDYKRSQNHYRQRVSDLVDGKQRASDRISKGSDDLTGDLFGPIEN
jgi:hypothetical protein